MLTGQVDLNIPMKHQSARLFECIFLTWRNLLYKPRVVNNQVTRVLGVKVLIGAVIQKEVRLPQQGRVNSDVLELFLL